MFETTSPARPPAANPVFWLWGHPSTVSVEGQILNAILLVSGLTYFVFAIENTLLGISGVGALIVVGLVYLGMYYLSRTQRLSIDVLCIVAVLFHLALLTIGWFANAGVDGSVGPFYITTIIAVMTIFRKLSLRILFSAIALLHFLIMVTVQYYSPGLVTAYPSTQVRYLDISFSFAVAVIDLMTYMAIIVYNLEYRSRVADGLLLSILPDVVADRLKFSPNQALADVHQDASILFADVVGFTPMSEGLAAGELIQLLNEVFTCFDSLAEQYGVEKIKTIGDCYMVAAGVPRQQKNHAQLLTDLALAMRQAVSERRFGNRQLSLRIGINSGPVVAGVIGRRKFIYDLWGDTVNTASRMESHGAPGHIQVTASTFELIKDEFLCEPRGTIEVKGKGQMRVWYVLRRRLNDARFSPMS